MSKEIELADHWERINRVVNEFLKGNTDAGKIAKITGFTRKDVVEYLNEWRGVVQSDRQVQMRAREALGAADQHYSMLIKEAWDVLASDSILWFIRLEPEISAVPKPHFFGQGDRGV